MTAEARERLWTWLLALALIPVDLVLLGLLGIIVGASRWP